MMHCIELYKIYQSAHSIDTVTDQSNVGEGSSIGHKYALWLLPYLAILPWIFFIKKEQRKDFQINKQTNISLYSDTF